MSQQTALSSNKKLSISQAAKFLGVSSKTLRRWEEAGLIHPDRNDKNQRVYSLKDLLPLIDRKNQPLHSHDYYQDTASESSPFSAENASTQTSQTLSISETADALNVTTKTIRRWDDQGLINSERNARNHRVFSIAEVERVKIAKENGTLHPAPPLIAAIDQTYIDTSIRSTTTPHAVNSSIAGAEKLAPMVISSSKGSRRHAGYAYLATFLIFLSLLSSFYIFNGKKRSLAENTYANTPNKSIGFLSKASQGLGNILGITTTSTTNVTFDNLIDKNFNLGVAGNLEGLRLISTTTTGAPLEIASSTLVPKLNADLLDGKHLSEIEALIASSGDLQAAYDAGKRIDVDSGNLVLALGGTSDFVITGNSSENVLVVDTNSAFPFSVSKNASFAGNINLSGTLTSGSTLTFRDANTPSAIPLSDGSNSGLPVGYSSILDVLADIGVGGGGLFTDSGTVTYRTDSSDDLAVGGTSLAAAFSVDVSENKLRIGDGADNNGQIEFFASDGDNGALSFNTSDEFVFSGGNVVINQDLSVQGADITGANSERIAIGATDDIIAFIGSGGTDNTDLFVNLDGSYPTIYSATDTTVAIDDNLTFVGARTISNTSGNITISPAGSFVVSTLNCTSNANGGALTANASGVISCSDDDGGNIAVEEGDSSVASAISTFDFLAADFTITESPAGEVNIAIDYSNSNITRRNQAENINAAWTFTSGISLSGSDLTLSTNNIVTGATTISSVELDLLDAGIALSELTDSGTLTASTVNIDGGNIDGTTIGAATAAAGTFTNLTANDNTILGNANTDTLTINAGTSGTGITFADASFQSCTALETDASGVLICGTDNTGSGAASVEENDTEITASLSVLDFLGSDFNVTNSPAGESNIAIDYANSGITRDNQTETISANWTFQTDLDATLADTENFGITSAISGTNSVDVLSLTLTNSSGSGTQNGIVIDNAASSGTTESLLVLDNSDADTAVTNAIQFINGGGGFTNLFNVNGTLISLAEFSVLDGGIDLGTDTNGNFVSNVTGGNGVTITGVAGEGWTPGIEIDLKTAGTDGGSTISSASGLEFDAGELSLIQGCADGDVLKWIETSDTWDCASDAGASGVSLQATYGAGNSIETSSNNAVSISETSAAASTNNLISLIYNAATGGTNAGNALDITLDSVDANGNTGNALDITIDQSQNTGNAISVQDDGANNLFRLDEDGQITLGTVAGTTAITITDTDYTNAFNVGDNNITGAGYSLTSTSGGLTVNSTGANLALTTTTSGNITLTPALTTGLVNVLGGNLQIGNGTPDVALNGEDAYIEGTLEVDGALRFDGALTANGSLTLGDGGDTIAIDSSSWDISAIGAGTGFTAFTVDNLFLDGNTLTTTSGNLTLDSNAGTVNINDALTIALGAADSVTIDADTTDTTSDALSIDVGTLTDGVSGADVNVNVTGDTGDDADAFAGLNITLANNATDQTTDDNLYGINIAALGGTAKDGNEYALNIGTGWDAGLVVAGTTIVDGSGNLQASALNGTLFSTAGDSGTSNIAQGNTLTIAGGSNLTSVDNTSGTITINLDSTLSGLTSVSATTLTDGTASLTSGALTGLTGITSSGTITFSGLSDGLVTATSGALGSTSTIGASYITADSLDFTELSDTLSLDASTSITAGIGEYLTYNKTYTDATSETGLVLNFSGSDSTSSTSAQYGLYLDNLASTEGLDSLLVLDNSDADDAVAAAITIIDAGGGFTNIFNIAGTTISASELSVLSGGIALGTDTTGNYVSDVTAGNGIAITGSAGEGWNPSFAIDLKTTGTDGGATTSSASGLEFDSGELTMIQGCSDGNVLKWVESSDTWACSSDNTGGAASSLAWDDLLDPDGALALDMGEYTSAFNYNTAATAAAFDAFTFSITNDASTDSNTQELLTLSNADDAGATGTTETLLRIENLDTNEAVTSGLIISSAAGGITTGIDLSDADIVTALALGSNDVTVGGATIDSTEFARLDGKDAALVDTNDAVATAITGTGALDAGSITSNFGSIDTGSSNITTTGTGTFGTLSVNSENFTDLTGAGLNINSGALQINLASNSGLDTASGLSIASSIAGSGLSWSTGVLSLDATELGALTFGSGSPFAWTFDTGTIDPTINFGDGALVFNEAGSDIDFRIEGDTNTNLFVLDAGLDGIGIGTSSIGALLDLGAATSSLAQLNLTSSAGTNVASPNSGDIWWNGTELFFNDGTSTVDILRGGTGALYRVTIGTSNADVIYSGDIGADINSVISSATADGIEIFIKAGDYTLTTPINWKDKSNLHIIGAGMEQVTITANLTSNRIVDGRNTVLNGSGTPHRYKARIQGITFDNTDQDNAGSIGIQMDWYSDVTIRDVVIRNVETALQISGGSFFNTYQNLKIEDADTGILLQESTGSHAVTDKPNSNTFSQIKVLDTIDAVVINDGNQNVFIASQFENFTNAFYIDDNGNAVTNSRLESNNNPSAVTFVELDTNASTNQFMGNYYSGNDWDDVTTSIVDASGNNSFIELNNYKDPFVVMQRPASAGADTDDFVELSRKTPGGSAALLKLSDLYASSGSPTTLEIETERFGGKYISGIRQGVEHFYIGALGSAVFNENGEASADFRVEGDTAQYLIFADASANSVGIGTNTPGTTLDVSGSFRATGALTLGNGSATAAINTSDWDIDVTGAITGVAFDANGTGNTITNIDNADLTNDTLDFDKFSDTLALDAATSITGTAGEVLTINRTLTDATTENGLVLNVTAADTTSGTSAQYGLYIDNLASTEGLDAGLVIDNSDADDSVAAALRIIDAGGGFTNILDIAGTLLSGTELGRLDGKDAALVDTNDAVATAITGTGALDAGSITSNFGSIDTGSSSITTTGTGTFGTLSVNSENFTDLTGAGLTIDTGALAVNLLSTPADALSATVNSASGFEFVSNQLSLLQGCGDGNVLKWDETNDYWECASDNTGGAASSLAWDDLLDADANLALSMNEYTTAFSYNTAATAAAFDAFTLSITNDATTDSNTQELLTLSNADDGGATGLTETLLRLENLDSNEAVTNGLIISSATGGITTAIDLSDSDIVTALALGSNDVTVGGATIDSTEFARLDGKDAALVDTNDAVTTAITGTGALDAGSITSNFGSIDTGSSNITTTGTGSFGTLTINSESFTDLTGAGLAINTGALEINLGTNSGLDTSSGLVIASSVAGDGLTLTAGVLDVVGGTGITANANDIAIDTTASLSWSGAQTFSNLVITDSAVNLTGQATDFDLIDNTASAFTISESTNNYLTITTTDASEAIVLGNATTNPNVSIAGTGSLGNGTWSIANDGTTTGLDVAAGQISGTLFSTAGDSGTSNIAQGNTLTIAGGTNITSVDNTSGTITLNLDATLSGLTSVSTSSLTATSADIDGGSIDGTTIGANSAAAGTFTALTATGNTIIGNANTDTLTINAGTSGTGISFGDSSFANCTALETVGGVLTCGSDATGVSTLQGAYDGGQTIDVDAADLLLQFSDATNDYGLVIDNSSTGAIATALEISSTGVGGTFATAIDLSDADIVTALALGSNDVTVGGATIDSTEFARLDGKDAALVDTNDAVATAITGTGALDAGSITSNFGSIDTGSSNITTTGTGSFGTLTINSESFTDLTGNGLEINSGALQIDLATNSGLDTASGLAIASSAAGNGLTLTAGVFDVVGGAGIVANANDIAIDTSDSLTWSGAQTFSNLSITDAAVDLTSQATDFDIIDNTSGAFTISEGANNYLNITTTDSSESITLGNATTNPNISIAGTGSLGNGTWSIANDGTVTGLDVSAGQISGTLFSTAGDSGTSNIAQGNTLTIAGGTNLTSVDNTSGTVTINLDSSISGLTSVAATTVNAGTLTINSESFTDLTGAGLEINTGALQIDLATNSGLNTSSGLSIDSSAAGTGLAFGTGAFSVNTSGGVTTSGDNVVLNLLSTPADALSATTNSASGFELVSNQLSLLQGCGDGNVLKWDEANDYWECATDDQGGAASSLAWDDLLDPAAGSLSLNMAEYTSTFNYNTAATAAAFDAFSFTLTNDATTDITTQELLTLTNADDGGATGLTETLLRIENLDTNEAVTSGLVISSAAGGITTGIDLSDSDIVTALALGSNDITVGGATLTSTELARLDGKDAALVDTNDAVATAITGTGALDAGSITSNFGSIDTGSSNITTTGTGSFGTLTINSESFTDLTGAGLEINTGALQIDLATNSGLDTSSGLAIASGAAGNGLTLIAGVLDVVGGTGITANANDIAIDTTASLSWSGAQTFSNLTITDSAVNLSGQATDFDIIDNTASAFTISESTNNYLTITTTDASETITLGNATTNPDVNIAGTGSLGNGTWSIANDGTTTGLDVAAGQISGTLFATAGDSGTSNIAQGNTLTIAGGTNITSVDNTSGTVTLNLDATLSGLTSVTSTTLTDGTATLTGGAFTGLTSAAVDSLRLDGTTIGLSSDTDLLSLADNALTVNGSINATSFLLSGTNINTGGTLSNVAYLDQANSFTDGQTVTGTITTAIDLSDANITTALALGSNDVTVGGVTLSSSELALLDSGIALSELTDSGTLTAGTVDINGGAIDGTTIGANAAAAGTFTTLASTGNTTIGDANSDTLTINAGTSGTGISFGDSSFANCTALETVGGVLTCGSDNTGAASLQDSYDGGQTIDVDTADLLIQLSDATNDYGLVIDNSSTGAIATALEISTTGVGGTFTTAIDLSDADIVTALALGANDVTVGGATISSTEFARLDGKDAALVDTNDAVATAITGTGALDAGSITSNFGSIDTGSSNITTTGTGSFGTLTINSESFTDLTGSGLAINTGALQIDLATNSGLDTSSGLAIASGAAGNGLTLTAGVLDVVGGTGITANANDIAIDTTATLSWSGAQTFSNLVITDSSVNLSGQSTDLDIIDNTANSLTISEGANNYLAITTTDASETITLGNATTNPDIAIAGTGSLGNGTWSIANDGTATGLDVAATQISGTLFSTAGDSGTSNIAQGNTLTIAGGTNLTSVDNTSGTVTINLDSTISGLTSVSATTLTDGTATLTGGALTLGAATDITTGSNQDLTLVANGTGVIVLNDTVDLSTNLITNIGNSGTDFTSGGGLTLAGTFDANGDVQIADTDIAFDGASTTFTTTGAFTLNTGGAITIGDGGDTIAINSSDWDISTTGAITGVAFNANGTGNSITNIDNADLTNDTLDFDKFSDSLALDAATSITGTAGEILTINRSLTNNSAESGLVLGVTASDTGAGTTAQYGLYIDNLASTEGLDAGLVIDNSDADDVVAAAIQIIDAGGGFTNILNLSGTLLSGTELGLLDSGIALSELTDSGTLTAGTVDINGGAIDGTTIGGASAAAGTFTALTANGNTILGDANTDTLTINAGISGTGITFADVSFQSCTALETDASGVLTCGTDDGGSFSSFTLTADSGSNETVNDGNTLTIAGGTNISTVVGATDTVTINLDDNITLAGTLAVNGDSITADGATLTINAGGTVDIQDTLNADSLTLDTGGITLANSETITNTVDGIVTIGRNDPGTVFLTAADNDSTAAFTILPGGAAGLTLGGGSTTTITLTTDGTGDSEVVLPTGSISGTEILDNTLNFTDFSNSLTLDAATTITNSLTGNLTLNLSSTGDFVIQDNGNARFTFADDGGLVLASGNSYIGLGSSAGRISFSDQATDLIEIEGGNLDLNQNQIDNAASISLYAGIGTDVSITATDGNFRFFAGDTRSYVFNDNGLVNNFRVEGDSDTDLLFIQGSTDSITIGSQTDLAKLGIDGDADEVQFLVQGNGTQTSNLVVFEQSDGTDVFSVTNAGNATLLGDLAVNGDDITSDGNLTLAATGYVRIGDTGTPGSANGDDDLYIEGDLEVDAISYFGGSLTLADAETISNAGGYINFNGFGGSNQSIYFDLDDATNPHIGTGSGSEIVVDQNLNIIGDIFVNGDDITSDGSLDISATGYVRIGDSSFPGTASSDDDLYVQGNFEVDGDIYVDGNDIVFNNGETISNATNGTIAFTDGSNTLASIVDQGTYGFIRYSSKTDTGNPASCTEGDTYYNSFDNTFNICTATNTWTNALNSGSSLWTDGTNGYYSNTEAIIVGPDSAETISNGSFSLAAGNLFVSGDAGIEGTLYVDTSIQIDSTSTTAFLLGDGTNDYFTFDGSTDAADTLFSMTSASSGITSGNALRLLADTITTGYGFTLSADALTTGEGFFLESTSTGLTSGGHLGLFQWNPGSATTTSADLFTINVGSNGTVTGDVFNVQDNGSDLFAVGQAGITSSVPHSFSAAGDVSIAYDLQFTNQTASYIKSNAPLQIEAGEPAESNNLTLKTYNNGDVVIRNDSTDNVIFDANGTVAIGENSGLGSANIPDGSLLVSNGIICVDNSGTNCDDSARTTGRIYANNSTVSGLDLAETYPSSEDLEAGEIIIVDASQADHVKRSTGAYQGSLGVISTDPGLLLGGFGTKDYGSSDLFPVALAGRVPVKVTAENGAINAGDLITSSSIAGVGMKATQAGQVVGRALEGFSGAGTGTIEVFVAPAYNDPNIYFTADGNLNLSGNANVAGDTTIGGNLIVQGRNVLNELNTNTAAISSLTTTLNTTAAQTASNSATIAAQSTSFSTNRLGIGKAAPATNSGKLVDTVSGAYLSDGGVWTNVSDVTKKENFMAVDTDAILAGIEKLDITSWNYIAENDSVRHIGPTAQDFYSAFGFGANNTSISTIDPAGIALAGIKGLNGRINALNTQVTVQKEANKSLVELLAQVPATIANLTTQISQLTARVNELQESEADFTSPIASATIDSITSTTIETQEVEAQEIKTFDIEATNATFGDLIADTIKVSTISAETIVGLDDTIETKVNNRFAVLEAKMAELEAAKAQEEIIAEAPAQEEDNPFDLGNATVSDTNADTNDEEAELDIDLPEATGSALLADDADLFGSSLSSNLFADVDGLYVADFLAVAGQASIVNAEITSFATIGNNLLLDKNAITALDGETLFIQPTGGNLSLVAGLITLDNTGLVTVNGDLAVNGNLVAKNIGTDKLVLGANSLDAINEASVSANINPSLAVNDKADLEVNLASGSALVIGSTNTATASGSLATTGATITASGSAQFETLAVRSNSGQATVTRGRQAVIVEAAKLTQSSQIIVTFEGDFFPATRYWITKDAGTNSFSINLDKPVGQDVKAYWLVIN